jgi:putative ABC transport system permease protein
MNPSIRPVLASLRHHRSAVALIALQVALTLAIVCNALFVVQQHVAHLSRPTGIDEANIGIIRSQWLDQPDEVEAGARMASDLATLRQLPGVVDTYSDYTYPAAGPWAMLFTIKLQPDQHGPSSYAEPYAVDGHALATLSLNLMAGRNFRPDEIIDTEIVDNLKPASVIVTQELADTLFPGTSAIGKTVYCTERPCTIIGVISHHQVPAVNTNSFAFRSVLAPARALTGFGGYSLYILRARPGELDDVLHRAEKALQASHPNRLIPADGGIARYCDLRHEGYAPDRGTALLMSAICAVLLLATAGGIVGLTSFWVSQRRRQIGIRRALGATLTDILRYFQLENALIVGLGIAFGMLLTVALNVALMQHFALKRLPLPWLPVGAAMLWLLGQLAVLGPALRASRVPPVVATRSV